MRRFAAAFGWTSGLTILQLVSAVAAATPAVRIPFEQYTLANGLRVIVAEDRRLPLIAANLRFHVGSANDPPGRSGFAHLFEHLYAFSPPEDVPSLQGVGATQDGATTDPDRTTYYTTFPSNQLEFFLALEADRLGSFPERLDAALLARERANVRNERRLVIENEPYGLADEAMFQQLFPADHPYHSKYVGSHAGIEAARLEEARQFFARYYTTCNATLVIAGDIDKVRAKGLIEKYLGRISAGAAAPFALKVVTPQITSERRITVTDRIESSRVSMAWVTPGWYQPGSAEAELLAVVLGNAAGRLRERLVRQQPIAQEIVVEYLPFAHSSVLVIKATARAGVKLQDLEVAIDAELAALRGSGPTTAELEQARNTVQLQIVRGLEKLGDITAFGDFTTESVYGGVAEQLNQCEDFTGDPGCTAQVLQRYQQATPATAREMLGKLTPNTRVVVHAVPGEKVIADPPAVQMAQAAETAAAANYVSPPSSAQRRFVAPAAGPPSSIQLSAPQRFTLSNGLVVLLAEQHHVPMVTAQLLVRGGSASSPVDAPGIAAFTTGMLTQGTNRRTSTQIAHDAAQLGSSIDTDISSDAAALSIRVLKHNLEPALDLVADVVMTSRFPPQELDRLRADQVARLSQLRTNPDTLASRLFTQTLYDEGNPYRGSGLFNDEMFARTHRYGYDESGTESSLKALTRKQLIDFCKRTYTPDNAALIVAGDVSPAELRTVAEKYFGNWSGKARAAARPQSSAHGGARVIIEDHGASSQTALRVGTIAAARSSVDVVPLRMTNFVLGEIFASRITTNLRGKHGYTYMARSQFAFRREPGPFVIGTNVRTDVTAPALQELFNELERLRTEPVTDEDLRFARSAFTGSLIGLFETAGKTATSVGQIFTYGLPLDYYQALPRQIATVTAADLQRVAGKYLAPENMVVVAVGDRAKIEQGVQAVVKRYQVEEK